RTFARVATVRRCAGIQVMRGVPEQPSAVRGLVLIAVIEIDVADMAGEIDHQLPPASIASAHEVRREARDCVVLVVVVGDKELAWRLKRGLVVCRQVAKVAPTELVGALALREET